MKLLFKQDKLNKTFLSRKNWH